MRHTLAGSLLSICALLCACGPSSQPGPAPQPQGPTYAQDVAPILSRSCSGCHVAGGIAPFALSSYADAKAMSAAIASAVQQKTMPPWMPGGDTVKLLHDRRLSDEEIATISAWSDH